MYMPGRLRTASRLRRLDAAFFIVAVADMLRICLVVHFRSSLTGVTLVPSLKGLAPAFGQTRQMRIGMTTYLIVVSRNGDQGARVGVAQSTFNLAAVRIVGTSCR